MVRGEDPAGEGEILWGQRQTFAGFLVPAFDCGKGAAAGFFPLGGYH
jgi:hypothetical protein